MLVLGSFHELAVDERRAGADERHKVRAVHGAPAVLGGLDQLVGHGQPRGPRPSTLSGARTRPWCLTSGFKPLPRTR